MAESQMRDMSMLARAGYDATNSRVIYQTNVQSKERLTLLVGDDEGSSVGLKLGDLDG